MQEIPRNKVSVFIPSIRKDTKAEILSELRSEWIASAVSTFKEKFSHAFVAVAYANLPEKPPSTGEADAEPERVEIVYAYPTIHELADHYDALRIFSRQISAALIQNRGLLVVERQNAQIIFD